MILKSNCNTCLGIHMRAREDLLFSFHCLRNRVSADGDTASAWIRGENDVARRLRLTCVDLTCEQGTTSDVRGGEFATAVSPSWSWLRQKREAGLCCWRPRPTAATLSSRVVEVRRPLCQRLGWHRPTVSSTGVKVMHPVHAQCQGGGQNREC